MCFAKMLTVGQSFVHVKFASTPSLAVRLPECGFTLHKLPE